jgi:creatinine amidohydrolase
MLWDEQSWPQIDQLDKGMPVVIPLGSCEQHGHHLPVGVDSIQVDAIAKAIERSLTDMILLTPTLWVGSSHHHLDFPGTVSLVPSLYSKVIQDITRSVLRAGFKRIFFLNGHGGNEVPVLQALGELASIDDTADEALLACGSWWKVGADALAPEKHGNVTPCVTHACEYEVSFMLLLREDLVNMGAYTLNTPAIDDPYFNSDYGGKVAVLHRFARVTAPGNMGDASHATKAKGQSMFDAVVDDIAEYLTRFADWPLLEKLGPKRP